MNGCKKMSKNSSQFISVDQAINEAVVRFRNGESLKDCLLWINGDEEKLTEWAYETDTFFDDEYAFLTSEDELFLTGDDILDYYEVDELKLSVDTDILRFVANRTESFEYPPAAHYKYHDEFVITAKCEIWGQTGPHFSEFDIFKSKEEYFSSLVSQGWIIYSREILSHSKADVVSMYKKNITDKYY